MFPGFCLIGLLSLTTNCSSSEATEPSEPEQPAPPAPVGDEYTFLNVEYRKWQSGTFQSWTTADSRETQYNRQYELVHTVFGLCSDSVGWASRFATDFDCRKRRFFRVANCAGRSYLLDPDNGTVIIHGIQHVRPGTSSAHQNAIKSKFGSEARWSEETGKLIADNHINYISYGSNRIETFPATVRTNLFAPKTQKVAYAENLYLLRTFMWDMSKNLGYAFDDDKYNRLVLLFEPTFASYIDNLVREKSALFAGDRHFIGFYLDNELPFASYKDADPLRGIDLKHFLSLPERYKTAREYAEKFMQDKGIASTGVITQKNRKSFGVWLPIIIIG